MNRRKFLSASTIAVGTGLAGCSSGDENDLQDSDDDGVIDSEDYAPNDPDVQEKSDLESTENITPTPEQTSTQGQAQTQTSTPTQAATEAPTQHPTDTLTSTPTDTPTATPTPTPTPTPDPNTLSVNDRYWEGQPHIVSYSSESVKTLVNESYPETDYDSAKLLVDLVQFPRGELVDEQLSDQFNRSSGPQEIMVPIDSEGTIQDELYNYQVALAPGDTTSDTISYSETDLIMESDPFRFTGEVTIERGSYPTELGDDSGQTYSRNNIEGAYELEVTGRTNGQGWTVGFFGWKSAHAQARNRQRGRSRPEYVSYELTQGTGVELAQILRDEADARGYNARQSVEFVIDFVQSLPYVPDDVSRDFDDYTKFIMETVPEMGGDCEDTAVLLASVLEAEPFGYDMILIQPPGHMAAGIWNSDPTGYHYEYEGKQYEYIETTGRGWGIGDCPEEYQGVEAYLYQV